MPDMIHNIVYQFAKQLREIYGDELKKVVVYGSYARGDYQKNSDVDIMILVDADDYEIKKRFNLVCDLAFDYELEYGVVISGTFQEMVGNVTVLSECKAGGGDSRCNMKRGQLN